MENVFSGIPNNLTYPSDGLVPSAITQTIFIFTPLTSMITKDKILNNKAAIWTVGIHALLLLLFALYSFTLASTPSPVEELGIEVNLGSNADGFGTDQPLLIGEPSSASTESRQQQAAATASSAQDMQENTEIDAPEVNLTRPSEKRVLNPTRTSNNERRTAPTRNTSNASNSTAPRRLGVDLYQGEGGNRSNENVPGGAEGNTSGNGDRGNINGVPGSPNYSGNGGTGTGGYSTNINRTLVNKPSLQATFREGGRVTLTIRVNRAGEITSARIKKAASAELGNIALQKIKAVRFSENKEAPPEQIGDFIFDFSTRRTN